jgi:hypothetical protein
VFDYTIQNAARFFDFYNRSWLGTVGGAIVIFLHNQVKASAAADAFEFYAYLRKRIINDQPRQIAYSK